jgi:hypothetical protein
MSLPDLISAPEWRPLVTGLLAVFAIALVWTYARCRASAGVRLACALLKAAAVGLLGLCLLEPMQTTEVPRQGANLFVIMADASQSLQVRDEGSQISREEQLRRKIMEDTSWQDTLDESFELRKFSFARQIKSDDFSRYAAEGIGSSVVTALASIGQRYRGQPLAGILLLTDGNATDLG